MRSSYTYSYSGFPLSTKGKHLIDLHEIESHNEKLPNAHSKTGKGGKTLQLLFSAHICNFKRVSDFHVMNFFNFIMYNFEIPIQEDSVALQAEQLH